MAELFSFLEKITLYKVIQQPTTIHESRENLKKVLSVIGQRRKDFPSKWLGPEAIESILKRDKQAIFGILTYFKDCYPNAVAPEKELVLNTTMMSTISSGAGNGDSNS